MSTVTRCNCFDKIGSFASFPQEKAFLTAALCGHARAVDELVKAGANVLARNACGRTPLYLAVTSGPFANLAKPTHFYTHILETVEILASHGALAELQSPHGETILRDYIDTCIQTDYPLHLELITWLTEEGFEPPQDARVPSESWKQCVPKVVDAVLNGILVRRQEAFSVLRPHLPVVELLTLVKDYV